MATPMSPTSNHHGLIPLQGRVAIVTGATGGIGSEVATHLASLGAKVVLNYLGDPAPADHLVSTINGASSSKPQAIAVEGDISDATQVKSLFDAAELAFGPQIHILVTTAAVVDYDYPTLANTSEEKWDWMFNTNAKGTFLCCRETANRLVHSGSGRIITFSSSGVGSLRPGYCAYAASKGAVEVMTKILAKELRGTGITANAIAPGPTETPMFYAGKSEKDIAACVTEIPMGRLGKPSVMSPRLWDFWQVMQESG